MFHAGLGAAVRRVGAVAWLALLLMFISACGGGGGGESPAGTGTTQQPTVLQPTAITTQPASLTLASGSSAAARFEVVATGDALRYQWQNSTDQGQTWIDVGAASAAVLTLSDPRAFNGRQFRVLVTGAAGTVTSSAVTLTVLPAPVAPALVSAPSSLVVDAGAKASFAVTATGTALRYQWQLSLDGASWLDVAGATEATFELPAVAVADSGRRYRVLVSNDLGSLSSAAALLTVTPPPVQPQVTQQPVAASVTAPQAATFTVAVSGTPVPTVQWQRSTDQGATYVDIVGATALSYTTSSTAVSQSGQLFRALVSNSAGQTASAAAALTVTAAVVAPTFWVQPAAVSVEAPKRASFQAIAHGTPTPTYQWQVSTDNGISFTNIAGATSSVYVTAATTVGQNGVRYRVLASNSAGTVTSQVVALQVLAAQGDLVTSVPTPNYAAGTPEKGAWTVLNTERGACGFGLLQQDTRLDAAAMAHSFYLTKNSIDRQINLTGHYEVPTDNYFVGIAPLDRAIASGFPRAATMLGEILTQHWAIRSNHLPAQIVMNEARGADSMRTLLGTVYHLSGAMAAGRLAGIGSSRQVGSFAAVADTTVEQYALTAEIGAIGPTQNLGTTTIATYPCDGAAYVQPTFVPASESPNPFPEITDTQVVYGTPIYFKADSGHVLTLVSASVTGPAGSVAYRSVTMASDAAGHLGANEVFLVPTAALQVGGRYMVNASLLLDGAARSVSFSFVPVAASLP